MCIVFKSFFSGKRQNNIHITLNTITGYTVGIIFISAFQANSVGFLEGCSL